MKTNIIVSCLTILLILSSFQILHTIKISMSEIIMNNNIMRIRIKFFPDDLASILSQKFQDNNYFTGTETDAAIMEYLHTYIKSNFSIAINNTPVSYTFKNFHIDHTASREIKKLHLVYECSYKNAEAIKTFELKNTLLFDGMTDQKNISKITLERKETKTLIFKNQNNDSKKRIQY